MAIDFFQRIYKLSSNDRVVNFWYYLLITIFLVIIFFPTTYVLLYVITRFNEVITVVFAEPDRPYIILKAILMSFAVSITVTVIEIVIGIALAWTLARRNFRGKELVNTLIESPLSIPTAGLGFSVALFWAITPSVSPIPIGAFQIINNTFVLIVLFHFTTTFPYVVRSLTEILEEIDKNYEIAALTCGASRFTAMRTITLPMFRSGLATAVVLAMAKSLSDTGGVVTLLTTMKGSRLIESDEIQGTALIDIWKHNSKTALTALEKAEWEAALSFVSFMMIILALILLVLIRSTIKNVRSPVRKVFPKFEQKISQGVYVHFRNAFSTTFILLFVFIPSFFILTYLVSTPLPSDVDWNPFLASIFTSFLVAIIATLLNVIIGVPMAIFITRKQSRITPVIDSLIDVPYLVPSAALGISVYLFWKSDSSILSIFTTIGLNIQIPDILLVIFAHMAMTFPFIARNVVGGLEEFEVSIEETARTLGARPLQVFKDITLPSIKGSILAGAVMGFTRSVGETGATLAVSSLETAPVYIVNQIKGDPPNYAIAAMATLLLMIVGYLFIWTTKLIINSAQVKKDIQQILLKLRLRKTTKIQD
ncbi:MAG: ABC transporter permease [Candidatus Hodarchaeales archaeon]|jgi:ABC-type sulfate transport system permease component